MTCLHNASKVTTHGGIEMYYYCYYYLGLNLPIFASLC